MNLSNLTAERKPPNIIDIMSYEITAELDKEILDVLRSKTILSEKRNYEFNTS